MAIMLNNVEIILHDADLAALMAPVYEQINATNERVARIEDGKVGVGDTIADRLAKLAERIEEVVSLTAEKSRLDDLEARLDEHLPATGDSLSNRLDDLESKVESLETDLNDKTDEEYVDNKIDDL